MCFHAGNVWGGWPTSWAAQAPPWTDAPLYAGAHAENNCMPQDETRSSLKDFDTKASILYLVSMSTFWILTVATGRCDRHALRKHETCCA